VQPTLDNWIKRNECNTTETLISPYPKGNPNQGAKMHIWSDGLDGVEVRLLELKDKGHWQSEDPVFCLTSIEAWNFMQRWSLGPDAPQVKSVNPEDGSFDLSESGTEITLDFDMDVEAEGVEAVLDNGEKTITLGVSSAGKTLTLSVPQIEKGEYNLTVRNVKGENGGELKIFKAHYTFGYEEVGDVPAYDVVFNPDLRAEESKVGEGIPTGWYRINTRSNGEKDEKVSGNANTGGARMKYFMQGGDFDEGFYLSARDYDRCEITYGRYTQDHPLHFNKGRYTATFNSVYWNEGSLNGKVTFDFTVRKSDGTVVATFPSLPSTGNMNEQQGRIGGATFHSVEFEIPSEGNYTVTYSMTSGWAAVIVGNLKIATSMSPAERYKGTFQRTLKHAREVYACIPAGNRDNSKAVALNDAIGRYESLMSTAPSVYEKATAELNAAVAAAQGLSGLARVGADNGEVVAVEYYNMQGQRLAQPVTGVCIVRVHYSDGTVKTTKCVVKE
ncbi:MAG: Ig-like domain-containing protein, partial [Duncaniella sp.]|nr:Ig-like domain-containing protein [Duncaniella sp.]